MPDRAADEPAVAGEPFHPELVGEDDDLVPAGRPFLAREVASELESVPHHRQEPRRVVDGGHLLRALAAREVHATAAERVQTLEGGRLLLPFEKVRRGGDVAVALDARPDHHELIRLRIGQRRQQRGVHDAENRGVRRDPEGEAPAPPPR